MDARKAATLLTIAVLALRLATSLSPAMAADDARPAGATGAADAKERAAYDAFVKSLKTEAFAEDYPGPLRDLDSPDAEKRIIALNVLCASQRIDAIPHVVAMLDSQDTRTRVHAGGVLNNIVSNIELRRRDDTRSERIVLRPRRPNDPDLTPLRWIVRKMLTGEDDGNTPAYGATMAAYIGLPDLEKELRALLGSKHPAVTRSAVNALRVLGFTVEYTPRALDEVAPKKQQVEGAGKWTSFLAAPQGPLQNGWEL